MGMHETNGEKAAEPSDILQEFLKKKPSQGEDLLTAVLETGRINRSAASRSLRVPEDVIETWASTLAEEGWLKPPEKDLDDPSYELSDSALGRLRELEREFLETALEEGHPEEKKQKKTAKPSVVLSVHDILIFASLMLSFAMVRRYLALREDTTPLIFGAFLLVASAVIYSANKQYSLTKMMVLLSISRFIYTAKLIIHNVRHVISFTLIVGVIYITGKFILLKDMFYLVAAIICFSMVPLVYQRRGNKLALIRLYIGLGLIIYALLLLAGLTSITEYVARKIRFIDILAGILLLIVLKVKESSFGLKVDSLKKFVEKDQQQP